MRLAAMACALMIVMCVAVFGAILPNDPPSRSLQRRRPRRHLPIRPLASKRWRSSGSRCRADGEQRCCHRGCSPDPEFTQHDRTRWRDSRRGPARRSCRGAGASPRCRGAGSRSRTGCRPAAASSRCGAACDRHVVPWQSQRARGLPHCRDRHDRGARFWLQEPPTISFRRRGGAHLRRRTLARRIPRQYSSALAAHCTKAIFFPIGLHATYQPSILKMVAAAGNAIGSHTWCHQDLSKTKGSCESKGRKKL